MIDYGVPGEKIKICGIPIHPKFQYQTQADKQATRAELGLDPEKFTVFINAGWPAAAYPAHFRRDGRARGPNQRRPGDLSGRPQPRIARAIDAVARRAPFPTKVIGYTNVMEKLMNAADVMVSKLGGLTTFEALASRLPIIADTTTPPMPQESQTGRLISRHNAGLLLERASDIAPIIRRPLSDPAEHAAMRLAASRIAIPDATKRIVDELMRKVEQRVPVRLLRSNRASTKPPVDIVERSVI